NPKDIKYFLLCRLRQFYLWWVFGPQFFPSQLFAFCCYRQFHINRHLKKFVCHLVCLFPWSTCFLLIADALMENCRGLYCLIHKIYFLTAHNLLLIKFS